MEISETLYVSTRKEWRKWLEKNFDKQKEIWLIFPKKSSGKPRVSYNDAVEEALAFGWIDSTVKKIDKESSAQRFTPRNQKSAYSQANKERLRWLLKEKMLHPSVEEKAKKILDEKFVFPSDIMGAIEADEVAWKNYQNFSSAYKKIRVAYIEAARSRPEEFKKRLTNFVKKTRENKQIGFGGINKYY
ncbi:MAG: YdeI/OmpD-associated family protein [Candidatus Bathyarchaeota archaeon]|nr:YdeI/OmpD-associated family protein [Candidatus Bathyarchaeum sp.]